ncbi:unnamed protein product [Caenorhabditis bovis]|uniref:Protein kinase domain-containing protein n=1 Tax=Caenorhabditis bovis TaxID=2654633 RepID=A0A8S1EBL5_9PELO|nr:unnamed protein product [Caenorhabditis bovis]
MPNKVPRQLFGLCTPEFESINIDEKRRNLRFEMSIIRKSHNDADCWLRCKDMEVEKALPAVTNLTVNEQGGLEWNMVPGAVLYIVKYKTSSAPDFSNGNTMIANSNQIGQLTPLSGDICATKNAIVVPVSEDGIGLPSDVVNLPAPKPTADPKLEIVSIKYRNEPFVSDLYEANGTIDVTFRYHAYDWPLGLEDLEVTPLFHLISCVEPDLSQGIPLPEFIPGSSPSTLIGSLGSDMMYRKCKFVYYLQSIASKTCATSTEMHSPPSDALQTVQIQCDTVSGAPCISEPNYASPICGQIDFIKYEPIEPDFDINDPTANVTLNVTFTPLHRTNEAPTIYYVGIYGTAVNYPSKEEETFLGVNITKLIGTASSCQRLSQNGECMEANFNNSLIIPNIHPQTMYGITICAIKDPRNLILPDVTSVSRSIKPKANRIILEETSHKNSAGLIVGVVLGGVAIGIILVGIVIYYLRTKHRKQEKLYKLKIAQIERETQNRYTDFPVMHKHDIWEIERRNLIIHNDKKLGSGAFGAVYLGKLIGKSLAHKDANSPLAVNLMRAENCEVAVKMLPEYADDMSKREFLREIGLMKTLGYHERLVNMLACITDSEPLCLVVEYCSDGDLHQYLRARCKYMMKLDELGINYHDPPINDNYDPNMVITIKQLLQFAVQISYGLEYLSQKGFVHRDVAARNVLVHNGTACKIGDFGLCRYIYADQAQYKSKGGRLPLKWMSPEAIRHYEFSIKSDVWSFGILLFEVITLGGSPYPGMPPEDVLPFLENGGRIEQPDNCPDDFYEVMKECWHTDPDERAEFSEIRQKLAAQLEEITEDYSYLKLDAAKDYYNVQYDDKKKELVIIPEGASKTVDRKQSLIDPIILKENFNEEVQI